MLSYHQTSEGSRFLPLVKGCMRMSWLQMGRKKYKYDKIVLQIQKEDVIGFCFFSRAKSLLGIVQVKVLGMAVDKT